MKRFTILGLCIAFAFSLQARPVTISGRIGAENGSVREFEVSRSAIGGKFMQPLRIDINNGKYSFTLDCDAPGFATLYAVVIDSHGVASQATLPVYLSPSKSKVKMDITFKEKMAPDVKTKDKNIQALAAYNSVLYSHFLKSRPEQNTIVPFLEYYPAKADSILSRVHCAPEVSEYIRIWSYTQVYDCVYMLYRLGRNDKDYIAAIQAIKESMPDESELFDKENALLFSSVPQFIRQSLKGRNTEELLADLHRKYSDKTVIREVEDFLFERFILSYDYNKDAPKGFERLQKMTQGNEQAEKYLDHFRLRTKTVIGSDAPEVVFLDEDGKEHAFSEFKGKYLYVDFWASWCIPCVNEIPHLLALEKNLKNDNVEFITISIDTSKDSWVKKMRQIGLEKNQFIIKDDDLANMLNIRGVPFYLIYDKNGKLLEYDAPRPSTGAQLKEMLENLK